MRFLVYGLKKQQRPKVSFLLTKLHTNLYYFQYGMTFRLHLISLINNGNEKNDDNNNISIHK